MDIPINANVLGPDGEIGRSICVIIDPREECISHVVVKINRNSHGEYLVPVGRISQSNLNEIHLYCGIDEVEHMDKFKWVDVLKFNLPVYDYPPGMYAVWPMQQSSEASRVVYHENTPYGELVVHKGSHVYATDGRAGQVDEFIMDPEADLITHVVLKEGHLWGSRDIVIPISQIDHIGTNAVYLKIDKSSIEKLPSL